MRCHGRAFLDAEAVRCMLVGFVYCRPTYYWRRDQGGDVCCENV